MALQRGNTGTVADFTSGTVKDTDAEGFAYLRCGDATNGYTFNRFDITVTDYYVEAYSNANMDAYVGFTATFRGNDNVVAALDDLGIMVNSDDVSKAVWAEEDYVTPEDGTAFSGFADGDQVKNTVKATANGNTATGVLRFGSEGNYTYYVSKKVTKTITEAIGAFQPGDNTAAGSVRTAIVNHWQNK